MAKKIKEVKTIVNPVKVGKSGTVTVSPLLNDAMAAVSDAYPPAPQKDDEKIVKLEARIVEIEGDMIRLVKAIGDLMGGPFATLGKEIVSRRQGAAKVP